MSASQIPKYSRQREKDRADWAYVGIAGKKIKLGLYGSPESHARYTKLLTAGAKKGDAAHSLRHTRRMLNLGCRNKPPN